MYWWWIFFQKESFRISFWLNDWFFNKSWIGAFEIFAWTDAAKSDWIQIRAWTIFHKIFLCAFSGIWIHKNSTLCLLHFGSTLISTYIRIRIWTISVSQFKFFPLICSQDSFSGFLEFGPGLVEVIFRLFKVVEVLVRFSSAVGKFTLTGRETIKFGGSFATCNRAEDIECAILIFCICFMDWGLGFGGCVVELISEVFLRKQVHQLSYVCWFYWHLSRWKGW